jgi:hypothetical protein
MKVVLAAAAALTVLAAPAHAGVLSLHFETLRYAGDDVANDLSVHATADATRDPRRPVPLGIDASAAGVCVRCGRARSALRRDAVGPRGRRGRPRSPAHLRPRRRAPRHALGVGDDTSDAPGAGFVYGDEATTCSPARS